MRLAHRQTATVVECKAALRRLSDTKWQELENLARVRVLGLGA